MANVISKTPNISGVIYEYKTSVNTPDYSTDDWLINPDVSGLSSVEKKYWKVSGSDVVEMSAGEKDTVDAAFPSYGAAAVRSYE